MFWVGPNSHCYPFHLLEDSFQYNDLGSGGGVEPWCSKEGKGEVPERVGEGLVFHPNIYGIIYAINVANIQKLPIKVGSPCSN